jgi:hypothetical protein
VQGSGGREELAAWVVTGIDDIDFAAIRDQLTERLPFYMVPSCYGRTDALPRTVGGKVKRDALPENAPPLGGERPVVPASTDVEIRLVDAAAIVLDIPAATISVDADFFLGCGGTSLLAAKWVSRLRQDAVTAGITVRDIYEARTIRDIATRIAAVEPDDSETQPLVSDGAHLRQFPLLISLLQGLVLLSELVFAALGAAWLASFALPAINLPPALLAFAIPLLGVASTIAWVTSLALRAIVLKWLVIGRYTPGDTGIWTLAGFRIWLVMHAVRQIPWMLIEGTCLVNVILRMLGARIGKGVHFHRGSIPILGGWDLLTIGSDAVIGQDAALELLDLQRSSYTIQNVTIGNGSSVGTRAVIDGGAALSEGSYLAPLSVLNAGIASQSGRTFQGIPAADVGEAPDPPELQIDKGFILYLFIVYFKSFNKLH